MTRKLSIALLSLVFATGLFAKEEKEPYTQNVAIVIYNGVEILDFAGPAEVFAAAAGFGANGQDRAFNVYLVSRTKAPIVSQGFIDVTPDYSIDDAPKPDIIVFPGGGANNVIDDPVWMNWVKTSAGDADHVLTVCTGAFVAGKAGLLEGLEATTWFRAVPGLAKEFPNTKVIPGRRFIDSGKMITTAGVSAGIDGSLHLVARLLGRYVADRVAEYMEYKWSPESYTSSTYPQFNPRLDARGKTLQQAAILSQEGDGEAGVAIYRTLLATAPNDSEVWLQLGRVLQRMKRYPEAIAANQEASKGERQRGNAFYNLSCAYSLTGQKDKAIESAGRAIEAGFGSKGLYQGDPDLAPIREDERFKALISKL